jgi:hypothetical protein
MKKNLTELAQFHGTDKYDHGFLEFYEKFLPMSINSLLEIGIGHGASLKMWAEYYPEAQITGLDIIDWSPLNNGRISTVIGDQSNAASLGSILSLKDDNCLFDIIVDDGGHKMDQQIISLATLIPHCKYYVLEDLHTAIEPLRREYGDGSSFRVLTEKSFSSAYLSETANTKMREWIHDTKIFWHIHENGIPSVTAVIRSKHALA